MPVEHCVQRVDHRCLQRVAGFRDAPCFSAEALGIEPVESVPGNLEVDRSSRERGRFRRGSESHSSKRARPSRRRKVLPSPRLSGTARLDQANERHAVRGCASLRSGLAGRQGASQGPCLSSRDSPQPMFERPKSLLELVRVAPCAPERGVRRAWQARDREVGRRGRCVRGAHGNRPAGKGCRAARIAASPSRSQRRPGARAASAVQTVTNDSPLCAAAAPSSVALTCFQLLSAFIRASQRCTLG